MKVVVRCAHNRVTKADMEREIERLFQENKDLRVCEGHLMDEVHDLIRQNDILRQQSEARRQVICERDKLIQELNDQIAADEEELAKSESESSQGMNAMVKFWEEAVNEKNKAEERAEEYRIALMESDCRVDECEKRMDWLSKEVLDWKVIAEGYKNQYEELKAQKETDDKKSEEICTACNEQYEEVLSERNRLRSEVALLTAERDTSVSENSELIFTINELQDKWEVERNLRAEAEKRLGIEQDQTKFWREKYQQLLEEYNELEADYDTLAKTKREYAEEIDRLRRVVSELQSNRFTTDEFIGMIMKNFMPSADK